MLLPFYLYYSDTALRIPGGSSIRSDYNYFSIGILVSGWIFLNYRPLINKYLLSVVYIAMTLVVYYSRSRRGLLYLATFPLLVVFLEALENTIDFKKMLFKLITQNEINDKLIKENEELKEHLKKYTAPKAYKKYYEKNKDKIIEYNKKIYLTKKQKKLIEEQNINKINDNYNDNSDK